MFVFEVCSVNMGMTRSGLHLLSSKQRMIEMNTSKASSKSEYQDYHTRVDEHKIEKESGKRKQRDRDLDVETSLAVKFTIFTANCFA